MNVKNLMMLLAITGLGASCSNDDYTRNGSGDGSAGLSEIQLQFDNTGESQEYSKAPIASEAESEISGLQVYLFASDAADGTYYYLETWTEGVPFTPPTTPGALNPTDFVKQASGTGWKASIYPNELKGLPYIKLLCIANNGKSATADGKLYAADGVTELPALVPVVTDPTTGTINNAAAATTEAAFKAAYTKNLGTAATDIIATPLLMKGEGKTKISGSVSKVNITLRRVMARFDIDNNTSTSNLTIQTITIANARKNASIWGAALSPVATPATDLMTYTAVKYDDKTNANKGTTESAIYVYPGLSDDASELIITGTYKSPSTNQQVPVTYNVPIAKTADGGATTPIEIKANSRYKLHISDVSQAAIYGTFEVVDWTSGGGISIKPDNDSPVFDVDKDPATIFEGTAGELPTAIAGSKTQFTVVDGKTFKMTVAATGKVRAEKSVTSTKTASPDWLTVAAPTYKEVDGVWYSTFELTATGATGELPVDVTFINEAASYDPALWTTLTFFGPKAAPKLEAATAQNSLGNEIDFTTDPSAITANMYNVVGGYIYVKAMCIEGTTVVLPSEFEELEADRVTEGFYTTFKIKIKSVLTDGNTYDIKFQNSAETTAENKITVTAVAAKLGVALGADVASYATITGADAAYTVKTDIDALSTNNYTLTITAPQGVDVTLPTDKWLTIGEGTEASGVWSFQVSLNPSVATYTDFDLEFTNKLDPTDKVTVTMTKAASLPVLAVAATGVGSAFNGAVTITDAQTATVDMYKANDSKVFVKMTCTEAASFDAVAGLTVTESGDEYEVKVTDATQIPAGTTTELIAKNSSDNTRQAKLTITWLDPMPAFTLAASNSAATIDDTNADQINVDYASISGAGLMYTPIVITVTGYKGGTITYEGADNTWLKATANPATIGDGGSEVIRFTQDGCGDSTATADITIKVTSAISNTVVKTIVLKKK